MGGKARTIFGGVLGLAAVWATGGGAAPWVASWLQVATVAYGAWAARDARKKAMDAQASALQDRKIMVRSGTFAKSYVYGRAWISGVFTFWRPPKSKEDPWAWLVMSLPIAHRIQAIDEIWFGDEQVTPLAPNGNALGRAFVRTSQDSRVITGIVPVGNIITVPVEGDEFFILGPLHGRTIICAIRKPQPVMTTGDDTFHDIINPDATATVVVGRNDQILISGANPGEHYTITYSFQYRVSYIRAWKFLGDPNQLAHQLLIDATANEVGDDRWTASDRLRGVPYIILALHVDPDIFPRDLENVTVLVKGKNDILDTRLGVNAYAENSMMIARDYALAECSVIPGEINLGHFNAEVNVCEELITAPDPNTGAPVQTHRYRTNAVLSTEVEPLNNLGIILSSCDGSAVYSGASFDLRCGHYEEPRLVLDDSDFAGAPQIVKGPERPELFNGVRARYLNSNKPFWPLEDCPAYISEFYKRKDGGRERTLEIDLPATNTAVAAQRLVKQIMHRARSGLTVQALFSTKALQLSPEQTIWLSLRSLGMLEKPFRIKSMRPTSPHQVELTMQEDGPLLYQWDFNEAAGVDPAPNSNLPSVRDVPLVEGLGAETDERHAVFGPDRQLIAQCKVFWAPVKNMLVLNGGHIEIRHKRSIDPDWIRSRELPPTATEHRFPINRNDVLIIEVRLANALVKGQWQQLRRTANDTPAPYIVSANRLFNAGLRFAEPIGATVVYPGWQRWFMETANSTPVTTQTQDPASGDGYLIRVFDNSLHQSGRFAVGGQNVNNIVRPGNYCYAESDAFAAPAAGTRLVVFSRMQVFKGDYFMQLYFRNGQNVFVGEITTGILRLDPSRHTYLPKVFGYVPAGASSARLRIGVVGTATGASTTIDHPFVGDAVDGQISLPPWHPGA